MRALLAAVADAGISQRKCAVNGTACATGRPSLPTTRVAGTAVGEVRYDGTWNVPLTSRSIGADSGVTVVTLNAGEAAASVVNASSRILSILFEVLSALCVVKSHAMYSSLRVIPAVVNVEKISSMCARRASTGSFVVGV